MKGAARMMGYLKPKNSLIKFLKATSLIISYRVCKLWVQMWLKQREPQNGQSEAGYEPEGC